MTPDIQLLHCDCMDYMAGLEDNAFELAIVDPPYGIGCAKTINIENKKKGFIGDVIHAAKEWDASIPSEEYFKEVQRVSVTFAQFELAWTSFESTCKKYDKPPNDRWRIHPTQKPVKLYQWLLANYAKEGDRILDTHLGNGSSAIAAHYAGFDFVGCELDPDYYKAAVERFHNETAQEAMF